MSRTPEEAAWNEKLIADFHAHDGQITLGRLAGASLLVMTCVGSKTGLSRTCPLGYHRDGNSYVIVGSNFGLPKPPEWVANVAKNPIVTIEVGTEKFQARARVTDGAERRRLLDDRIAAVPIFGDYERKANRDLPVVVLERID
jgi:deazaflavin-dependent oxidoreductase (nitroreductase family)